MKKILLSVLSGFGLSVIYRMKPIDKRIEDMPSWPV
jgi:hypothetical protein